MTLAKKLVGFWFIIVTACLGTYLMVYNQEPIHVLLPGFGEFKVLSALAFIAFYLLGVTTVTLYFLIDVLKNSFKIKSLNKRVRLLESDLERERSNRLPKGSLSVSRSSSDPTNLAPASSYGSRGGEKFPPDGELF